MTDIDYIIVGAGSAGCVLANRLSSDPNIRVCLLEAGPGDGHPLIHVPAGVAQLIKHRRFNWRYWTVPQQEAAGRSIYVPRGKTLGGSSSINGMVYMRGHRTDFDDWADAGNPGWSYADVLPYFLRSEDNATWRASPYHGTNGPLRVVAPEEVNPLVDVFFNAAASQGIVECADFNGEEQDGYGLRQLTQRGGKRESTATAFLRPARKRKNLLIMPGCNVHRVLFTNQVATGVEFTAGDRTIKLEAKREVVLAAGAIGSPLILKRSGIGPAAELKSHGIEVVADLPGVGSNYQDHIATGIYCKSPLSTSYGISLPALPRLMWQPLKYLLFRRGLLASMPINSCAFVKTSDALARPDLQLIFAPILLKASGGMGFGHGYGLIPLVLRPKSRGHIRLSDADPNSPPLIDPRFLSDEADLMLLLEGVKRSLRLLADPVFDKYRGTETAPGANIRSDDALKDYIRQTVHTAYHPVGTCKMGNDREAVVDANLRVRHVEKLRVADASIMPTLVGGNTNAAAIMIGEKASDLILGRLAAPRATISGIYSDQSSMQ